MKYSDNYKIDYSQRKPVKGVENIFSQRWSPRSFKKTEIKHYELETIIDAARWSQSAYNEQPWRFLTSTTESFNKFLNLLVDQNQIWAKDASVLGFIVAKRKFSHNQKPNNWADFDSGAAWMSLTLQARQMGLYTHGMAGIKKDEVYEVFGIDKDKYHVICAFAIGAIDEPEKLDKNFRKMEKPSARKALNEIWKEGEWREK